MSIVMLSESVVENEVASSYRAGANHFVQKPSLPARMDILVRTLYRCSISTNFGPLTRLEEYRRWPSSDLHPG
jgi:DNA-binding NarL/FixJ family response regulator